METYKEGKKVLFGALGNSAKMVLATSVNDEVSARTMSIVICGEKFFFQTDAGMDKVKEIEQNPNVALCSKGYQIKGRCKSLGHPLLEENKWFIDLFREFYPNAYEKYSHLSNECVYEITPVKAKIWKSLDQEVWIEYLDFEEETVELKQYMI